MLNAQITVLILSFPLSAQPVVKLLINRHNNKYSYTNTSDDNLLKNIELFDKLSLRFSGRILFIKDVIGSSEICCWSFYGNGRKIAEVSLDDWHSTAIELKLILNVCFIFDRYVAHQSYMQPIRNTQKLSFLKLGFMKKHYKYYCTKIAMHLIKIYYKRHPVTNKLLLLAHTPAMKKRSVPVWHDCD